MPRHFFCSCGYFNKWTTSPLLSFGSNHVDFGGMTSPASALSIRLWIEVG